MPYKSAKQRAFMHVRHPEIAKRWDDKYGGKIKGGGRVPKQSAGQYMQSAVRARRVKGSPFGDAIKRRMKARNKGGRGAIPSRFTSPAGGRMTPMPSGRSIPMHPVSSRSTTVTPTSTSTSSRVGVASKNATPLQEAIRRRMASQAAQK